MKKRLVSAVLSIALGISTLSTAFATEIEPIEEEIVEEEIIEEEIIEDNIIEEKFIEEEIVVEEEIVEDTDDNANESIQEEFVDEVDLVVDNTAIDEDIIIDDLESNCDNEVTDIVENIFSYDESDVEVISEPIEDGVNNIYDLINPYEDENGVVTWDCIWFGNFWQHDTNGDGVANEADEKEPIKWRVLKVQDNEATIIADQEIGCQPYLYDAAGTSRTTTWEGSTVRKWLNSGTGFWGESFNINEQNAVFTTNVITPANKRGGGNDTFDKVYVLSIPESLETKSGFGGAGRRCTMTDYAKNIYLKHYLTVDNKSINNRSWLRSPGNGTFFTYYNSYIDSSYGGIDYWGQETAEYNYVRPVLHLDLSKYNVYSYAGIVKSSDFVNEAYDKSEDENAIRTVALSYKRGFYSHGSEPLTEIDVNWGFNQFSTPSSTYNKDLALTGAVLSRIAYMGAEDRTIAKTEFEKLGIDDAFATTKEMNPLWVGSLDHPFTLFGYEKLRINDSDYNFFIVDVRGTSSLVDSLTDLFDGVISFTGAEKATRYDLKSFMSNYTGKTIDEIKQENNIFFLVGHSLGGAVANRMSVNLQEYAQPENIYTYTFAAPHTCWAHEKLTNPSYAFNVKNIQDPVTHVAFYPTATSYGDNIFFNHEKLDEISFSDFTGGCTVEEKSSWMGQAHNLDFYVVSLLSEYNYNSNLVSEIDKTDDNINFIKNLLSKYIDVDMFVTESLIKACLSVFVPYEVEIACPVDVEVYKGDELISKTVGEEYYNYNDDVACIYTVEDRKYLYAFEDTNLMLKIKATDAGTMAYRVYTIENNARGNVYGFENIELSEGKEFIAFTRPGEGMDSNWEADIYVVDESGDKVKVITGQGEEHDILKVMYDANGADGNVPMDSQLYVCDDLVTVLESGELSREDYTFECWNTEADGSGINYNPGDTIVIKDNICLYAIWKSIPDKSNIVIDKKNVTISLGDSIVLSVVVYDKYGDVVANPSLQWISSNEEIASVDNGVITANSVGTAVISAKYNELVAYCNIAVEAQKSEENPDTPEQPYVPENPVPEVCPDDNPNTGTGNHGFHDEIVSDEWMKGFYKEIFNNILGVNNYQKEEKEIIVESNVNGSIVTINSDPSLICLLSTDSSVNAIKQEQGVLCRIAFAFAKPIGYSDAFSFNLVNNGNTSYSRKIGRLVLYIPVEFRKPGRRFSVVGVNKTGSPIKYDNQDYSDETVTVDIDIEGYAFNLIYKDGEESVRGNIPVYNANTNNKTVASVVGTTKEVVNSSSQISYAKNGEGNTIQIVKKIKIANAGTYGFTAEFIVMLLLSISMLTYGMYVLMQIYYNENK